MCLCACNLQLGKHYHLLSTDEAKPAIYVMFVWPYKLPLFYTSFLMFEEKLQVLDNRKCSLRIVLIFYCCITNCQKISDLKLFIVTFQFIKTMILSMVIVIIIHGSIGWLDSAKQLFLSLSCNWDWNLLTDQLSEQPKRLPHMTGSWC